MTPARARPKPPGEGQRTSPYVGLEPYSESDAPFFFGREQEARITIANLRSSRLTLLYGASGVGKSSVIMAGVVSGLREKLLASASRRRAEELGRLAGVDGPRAQFAIVDFSAWLGPRPLERLMERVRTAVEEALGGEQVHPWDPGEPVVEVLRAWTARVRTLLVVLDQFEEYFLYHPGEDGDGSFHTEFPRIVNDRSLRVHFLVSIREDAWAKLDRFKGRIPHLFSNYLRVNYLDWESAGRAIEGPVEEYNRRLPAGDERFSVEPALIEAVLDEVRTGDLSLARGSEAAAEQDEATAEASTRNIETPFLQLVMQRLWEEALAKGLHELRKETLDELGGARRIVSTHLDQSLAELDRDERTIAAEAFRFLVTPAKTKIAQRASDIAYWAKRPEEDVLPVLERLSSHRHGRVLRPLPPPPGEEGQRYEIFHDVLAEAILDWRKRWEQERAKEALANELGEQERRKLAAERERHQERRNRLVRRAAGALLVLAVALAVMTVVALHQRGLARSRAIAASSIAQLQTDPELSLLLAREAWKRGSTREAEQALRRSLAASHVRTVLRVARPLVGATLSRDGKLVATAAEDGSVSVRSAATGHVVPTRLPRFGDILALSFSPDGRSLVAADEERAAIARIGPKARAIELDGGRVSANFSPSGRYVATARGKKSAAIWDARTGGRLASLKHGGAVDSVAFNPRSDRLLATASLDERRARVWDWRSGRSRVLRRPGERDSPVGDEPGAGVVASFSPDGRRVATALADKRAQVWDARSGAVVAELRERAQTISGLRWSPDGHRIVTAGDKAARVFDASNGRMIALLAGHADFVNAAALSPGGGLAITASDDGTARIWDVGSAATLTELRGHTGEVTGGELNRDGSRALTSSFDGTARIWDVSTGRALRGHRDLVLSAAYDLRGDRVVTASTDGTARIWRLADGAGVPIRGVPVRGVPVRGPRGGSVRSASFSRDGSRIVLAAERGLIVDSDTGRPIAFLGHRRVVDAEFSPDGRHVVTATYQGVEIRSAGGKLERSPKLPRGVEPFAVAYSSDGKRIVVAGSDGVARVFDGRGRHRQVATFRGHDGTLTSASFSPDGKLVVTAAADNTARVWEAATGRQISELRGHTALVRAAAFSPDGRRVVTGSADKTTRVWETRSGRSLSVQREHADSVNDVAFSPDGKSILSASDDNTAKIYGCETCSSVDDLLALAKRRVTRSLTADERRELLGEG